MHLSKNKNAFQKDAYRPLQWQCVSPGGCLPGQPGVCLAGQGGVCLGVSAWPGGCLPGQGGVCLARGCLFGQGGRLLGQRGVCSGGCTPPPANVDRMIDTFENITFPQLLLQMVKRKYSSRMRTTRLLTLSGGGGQWVCIQGDWVDTPPSLPTGRGWADPHPVNGMTDACENIILPQTSFAGGKKLP